MDTGEVVYQFHLASGGAQEDVEGILRPLRRLLQHSDVTKVMFDCQHAAALLFQQYGCVMKWVFDLQVCFRPCTSCLLSAVLCDHMCDFLMCLGGMWGRHARVWAGAV